MQEIDSGMDAQLETLGLHIKNIPGDGNCLFRALGDQLDGSSEDHLHHRAAVVEYMRQNRQDFLPFVEDDKNFDSRLSRLSETGTYGGNQCIVAFSRLHSAVWRWLSSSSDNRPFISTEGRGC